MNFISFLVFLMLFIIIYIVVVEIFTVLLRMTGVTADKARTQVISMLTSCGFTTNESELILSSRMRRRLAQVIMLCGHAFSVVIVSVLVNLFLSLNQSELRVLVLPTILVLGFMVVMLLVMCLKPVRTWFDQRIEKVSSRFIYGKSQNALVLVDTYRKRAMVEVLLEAVPEALSGVALSESRLKEDYDIQILLVTRHGEPVEPLNGKSVLMAGDALLLFGNHKNIRTVFTSPKRQQIPTSITYKESIL